MKHKFAVIGFSYLTGLICASFLSIEIILGMGIIAVLIGILCLLKYKYAAVLCAFTIAIALGAGCLYNLFNVEPALSLDGKTVDIVGTITDKGDPDNDNASYIITAEMNGADITFTLYGEDTPSEIGDTVRFTALLSKMNNNMVFAEKSYYSSKGIFLKATAKSDIIVEKSDSKSVINYINDFSDYINGQIMSRLPNDYGGFLCGIFLGDKSNITSQLKTDIKMCGLSHLTAVSGLHLTLTLHIMMLIIGLTPIKSRRKLKFVVLSLIILTFMIFFRLSPSVIRASIMLIIYYGAELFMRKGETINSVGCALFIILFVSPSSCTDIGLILSAAGTIAIGSIAPAINNCLNFKHFKNIKEKIVSYICVSLCTLPLSAIFFGGASVASPIANLIIEPFFIAALVSTLIFALCGGISNLFLFIAGICSRVCIEIIGFIADIPNLYIRLDGEYVLPWAILSVIFVTLVYIGYKKPVVAAKSAMISVCMLAVMITCDNLVNRQYTKAHIFSDGKNGCIIINGADGIIIESTGDSEKISRYIYEYLKTNGISKIDIVRVKETNSNNLEYFMDLAADYFIVPDSDDCCYESGKTQCFFGDNDTITVNGTDITVCSVKDNISDDITVRTDYKLSNISYGDGLTVYLNKRQSGTNAFYEDITFYINGNGEIRKE